MLYICKQKICICGLAEVLSPQTQSLDPQIYKLQISKSQERLGQHIANPQSAAFAGGRQTLQII